MKIPPPVSGEAYPAVVGSEIRTNYLTGGMNFETAYNDNVLPGFSTSPVSDVTYFIAPTMSISQNTPHHTRVFRYSPGFRLYQHTSELNVVNQNADASFEYRLSPYTAFKLQNTFQQNSNAFNQPNLETPISGSTQSPTTGIIAPYANSIKEDVRGGVSYQFGRNAMIGGGGNFGLLNYPSPDQAVGLYNFKSVGGSAFYSRRLSNVQYMGGIYQYTRTDTEPVRVNSFPGTTTQINGIFLFYTFYLKRSLSISMSGGSQHLNAVTPSVPTTNSWKPAGMASMGWQANHFNVAASFSRTSSAGNGFGGAFDLTNANALANWQISRLWTASLAGAYMDTKSATPLVPGSPADGHSVFGDLSLQHKFGDHVTVMGGYSHLHQSYGKIPTIAIAPNSGREYLSVAYTFTRPLGR
jgi:hypothetical protein